MKKTSTRLLVIGGGVLIVTMILGPSVKARRSMRRGVNLVARRARYARGRLEGLRYRITRRTPDPWVGDEVLADRIRSTLGPLEKRLDLPRVHVMVDDHVAVLHGDVAEPHDAATIERAVSDIAGVRGVESYLHIGLSTGNTRPSEGRAHARELPSPALRELVDAAVAAGAPQDDARRSVRAVKGRA
jgi:hypothetical protein